MSTLKAFQTDNTASFGWLFPEMLPEKSQRQPLFKVVCHQEPRQGLHPTENGLVSGINGWIFCIQLFDVALVSVITQYSIIRIFRGAFSFENNNWIIGAF